MEPVFKRKLELFLEMHPDGIGYNKIINKIQELIKNEKPIVFVDEVEASFTEVLRFNISPILDNSSFIATEVPPIVVVVSV